MSWNKQESNAVTETITGDLSTYISKYSFTLLNDKTSEYITLNINNYVNIEKNGNIANVSLQLVDDSSYYKLKMNLINNDTISESVITITAKNIIGTNNLTYTLKQIFGKKIWLKLFNNDEFISDKYYAIKIALELISFNSTVNINNYRNSTIIKNIDPLIIAHSGTIDVLLLPKYYTTSDLGFIDISTNTEPIIYAITREQDNCQEVTASRADDDGKLKNLVMNIPENYNENIDVIYKFEKADYPIINLHIVNNLIKFIYNFKVYLKYNYSLLPTDFHASNIFLDFYINNNTEAGETSKYFDISKANLIKDGEFITDADTYILIMDIDNYNNLTSEYEVLVNLFKLEFSGGFNAETKMLINYDIYYTYNSNNLYIHSDSFNEYGICLYRTINNHDNLTYGIYWQTNQIFIANNPADGDIGGDICTQLLLNMANRLFLFSDNNYHSPFIVNFSGNQD